MRQKKQESYDPKSGRKNKIVVRTIKGKKEKSG